MTQPKSAGHKRFYCLIADNNRLRGKHYWGMLAKAIVT